MVTAYDVRADALIKKVASHLKEEIEAPESAKFLKTGEHKSFAPVDEDWWWTRAASILRKLYIKGSFGVNRLSSEYGGKKDRGSKPYRAKSGSGAITRRLVQQLEAKGYLESKKGKGRSLSPKGRAFLDRTAYEISKGN